MRESEQALYWHQMSYVILVQVQRSHSQKKQLLLVAQSLAVGSPDRAAHQNDAPPPQRAGSPPPLLPPITIHLSDV